MTTPESWPRWSGIGFPVACMFLFVMQVLVFRYCEPVLSRDSTLYLEMIHTWLDSGNYGVIIANYPDHARIPALPLFLVKTLAGWGMDAETAGVGISMLAGAGLPMAVYFLAEEIQGDRRISCAASLLAAVNPAMIEFACEVQREMLYITACGWCFFFCAKGLLRQLWWPWIPAGGLFAVAILSRHEILELLPILLISCFFFCLKKKTTWKKAAGQCALMAGSGILVLTILIGVMGVREYIFHGYSQYYHEKYGDLLGRIDPREQP